MKQNLTQHMSSQSNARQPLSCSVCEKAFQNGYKLNRHMLSHTNERSFKCIFFGMSRKAPPKETAAHIRTTFLSNCVYVLLAGC